MLSSYSIIINYFSRNKLDVEKLLGDYCNYMNIPEELSKKDREKEICKAYHAYCLPINKRGFDYIKELHEKNELGTREICDVFYSEFLVEPVSSDTIDRVKNSLKQDDRLLMALYPYSTKEFHAIVIGWDTEQEFFFVKDPNIIEPFKAENIFNQIQIYEYILFKAHI